MVSSFNLFIKKFFLRIIYKFHRLLSTKRFVLHSVQNNCKRANGCGGKEVVKLVELGDKKKLLSIILNSRRLYLTILHSKNIS